jgi:drug/metabolite transporter (DMT)-like permease
MSGVSRPSPLGANLVFAINPVLWGSFYPVTKGALDSAHPIGMIGTSMATFLIASAVLLPGLRNIRVATFITAAIGVVPLAAAYITSAMALNLTTATNTGVFPALTGVIALVISCAVLRRGATQPQMIAGVLSIIGVILMIWESSKVGGHWWGDIIALLSTICYTSYIFTCRWLALDRESAKNIAIIQCFYLGFFGIILSIYYGGADYDSMSSNYIMTISYIGFGTLVIPTVISLYMIRWTAPVMVSFIYILEPVWSAVFSFFYLGEMLTMLGYIGALVVLAGAALMTFQSVCKTSMRHH